jgi:hypothetical protein
MVRVLALALALGPKVRGFKPSLGNGFLRAIKSASNLPTEGK